MQNNLIERKQYMQMLRNLKDQNLIKVISGVRRCGKSTLLQTFANELLQNGIDHTQVQFLNFEDLDTIAIGDIYYIVDPCFSKSKAKKRVTFCKCINTF
jgi:predicted AAA+ superfamily ATPase